MKNARTEPERALNKARKNRRDGITTAAIFKTIENYALRIACRRSAHYRGDHAGSGHGPEIRTSIRRIIRRNGKK